MARSKEFDPDTALERAMGQFWAGGYDGTSMQDLLAAMRLGKRSLYDTFGNKHTLYLRVLTEYVRRAELVHEAVLDGDDAIATRVRALLRSNLRLPHGTPPGCFAVNAGTNLGQDPEVRTIVSAHFQRSTERLAAALRHAGVDNPSKLAPVIHAGWVGLRAQSAAGLSESGQREIVDQIAALVD